MSNRVTTENVMKRCVYFNGGLCDRKCDFSSLFHTNNEQPKETTIIIIMLFNVFRLVEFHEVGIR